MGGGELCFGDAEGSLGHLGCAREAPRGRGAEASRQRLAGSSNLAPTRFLTAVPPTISVPKGRAVVTVREGSPAELQCEVRGKPRPPVLWSRVDKEAALLPSGLPLEETPDGKLRLEHVSRDMSGTYRCQTARYNGFNVRPREAQVQLNVQCESHRPTWTTSELSLPIRSLACPPLHPFVHSSPTSPLQVLRIPLEPCHPRVLRWEV